MRTNRNHWPLGEALTTAFTTRTCNSCIAVMCLKSCIELCGDSELDSVAGLSEPRREFRVLHGAIQAELQRRRDYVSSPSERGRPSRIPLYPQ